MGQLFYAYEDASKDTPGDYICDICVRHSPVVFERVKIGALGFGMCASCQEDVARIVLALAFGGVGSKGLDVQWLRKYVHACEEAVT